jgi:hypothetical protein
MMETAATISPMAFLVILAVAVALSLGAGYFARKLEEPPKPQELPQPATPTVAHQTVELNEHTALKVTLDKSLAWHVEVDGARIVPGDLTAEQRARLVNILVQIRPWLDGKIAAAPAPAPAPVASPTSQADPLRPLAVPATATAKTQPPSILPPEKPKIDVMRGFRSLVTNDLKVMESAKPISIVAMIDDFLQKRLAGTHLADKEIRLEEGALGEVIVLIGKSSYPGVDAVPDPQIQAVIRAAISDWEKNT